MRNLLILLITIISVAENSASASTQQFNMPPYLVGEKLTYRMKLKKVIWLPAGTLVTEVVSLNKATGEAEFNATATSTSTIDVFCKVRETVTSSIDLNKNVSTHYLLKGRECSRYKTLEETFDYAKSKGIKSLSIDDDEDGKLVNKEKTEKMPYDLTANVQDVLSMLYFVRAANLPTQVGSEIKFSLIFEGELFAITFKYLEPTTARVKGTEYPARKYQMIAAHTTKVEVNSSTTLVIADDDRKTLVQVNSEVDAGKISLSLQD